MSDTAAKSGWTTVAFGDVVRQVKHRVDPEESGLDRYVAGEHMDTDDLRIRRWGEIGDGYLGPAFHMLFKPGQVLYGSRRTYLRKVAVADFEGITANTTYVLEPRDPDVLIPEMLPFIMKTDAFHAHSIRESKGSVNPYVNFSDLAWFEFAFPPLQEQRRIVQAMRAAAAAVTTLEDALSLHQLSVDAALLAIFEGLDVPSVALSDIAVRVTNGFVGSAVKHYVEHGVPYLRSLNVRRSGLDLENLVFISSSFHEATKKSQLQPGDLLTVQSGHVGETAVVPPECAGWNCHALILTRLRQDLAVPDYVSQFLNSIVGQRELARHHVGSTVAHLNTSDLARLMIPLPGLDEQLRIAGFRTAIVSGSDLIRSRLQQAQRVRDGVMAAAFPDGRVRL